MGDMGWWLLAPLALIAVWWLAGHPGWPRRRAPEQDSSTSLSQLQPPSALSDEEREAAVAADAALRDAQESARRALAEQEARERQAQALEEQRLADEREAAEREAQQRERDRLAAEQAARLLAEQQAAEAAARAAEQQRQAAEEARLAAERLEAERQAAEAARLRAEQEAAAAAAAEAARRQAERLEAERLAAQRAEAERLQIERLQAQRLEAERQAAEAARAEAERQAAAAAEAEAERQRLAAAPPAPRAPQQTLVMVADDSKVVRVKTSRLLAAHQFRVALAEDGSQALQLMAQELPQVLITDVEMPGMDGMQLTRALRADSRTAQLPVIMITSADDRLKDEAAAAGVTVLMGKPYTEADLVQHVARLSGAVLASA